MTSKIHTNIPINICIEGERESNLNWLLSLAESLKFAQI